MKRFSALLLSAAVVSCQSVSSEMATSSLMGKYELTNEDRAAIEAGIERSLKTGAAQLVDAAAHSSDSGTIYMLAAAS